MNYGIISQPCRPTIKWGLGAEATSEKTSIFLDPRPKLRQDLLPEATWKPRELQVLTNLVEIVAGS